MAKKKETKKKDIPRLNPIAAPFILPASGQGSLPVPDLTDLPSSDSATKTLEKESKKNKEKKN